MDSGSVLLEGSLKLSQVASIPLGTKALIEQLCVQN